MAIETETPIIKKPRKKMPWTTIGILVSTFAVIVLLFSVSMVMRHLLNVDRALLAMQTETETKFQALQNQVMQNEEQFRNVIDVKERFDKLQTTVNELQQTQKSNNDQWVVSEAFYLIKLANMNALYTHNIPQAITLLQLADQALVKVSNPKLVQVRMALANDITHLQGIPVVDMDGIYARLTALQKEINQLPLINQPVANELALPATDANLPWWKRGLQNTWGTLQKLVVVRYNDANSLPLLPEQRIILYQNCHAEIAEAIWALLHGEQDIYLSSLEQFETWVKTYFVKDAPLTQAVLMQIADLQKTEIRPATPTITALEAIQAVHA